MRRPRCWFVSEQTGRAMQTRRAMEMVFNRDQNAQNPA